jgi:hypothetical protein
MITSAKPCQSRCQAGEVETSPGAAAVHQTGPVFSRTVWKQTVRCVRSESVSGDPTAAVNSPARLMRHGASWGPNCRIRGPMREAIPNRLRLLCVEIWPMMWSRHPRNRQTDDAFMLGSKLAMNETTHLLRGNTGHSHIFRYDIITGDVTLINPTSWVWFED